MQNKDKNGETTYFPQFWSCLGPTHPEERTYACFLWFFFHILNKCVPANTMLMRNVPVLEVLIVRLKSVETVS